MKVWALAINVGLLGCVLASSALASPFIPKEPKSTVVTVQPVVEEIKILPELLATKKHAGVWSAYLQGGWFKVGDRVADRVIKQIGSMHVRFSDGSVVRLLGTAEEKAKIEVRYEK